MVLNMTNFVNVFGICEFVEFVNILYSSSITLTVISAVTAKCFGLVFSA